MFSLLNSFNLWWSAREKRRICKRLGIHLTQQTYDGFGGHISTRPCRHCGMT